MTEIKFRAIPASGIHHGSGTGTVLVDREILRTPEGFPYLAGSALKGKFRHAASVILRTGSGDPHAGSRAGFCVLPPRCPVCRIFGCPMSEGAAHFGDALPIDLELASPFGVPEVRATSAIDRQRRIAKAQHLFTTEIAPVHIVYEFTIWGRLNKEDVELLHHCSRLMTHFGSGGSRGLGAVRFEAAQ